MAILVLHDKVGMNAEELRRKLKEKSSYWKLNQLFNALEGRYSEFEQGYDTTILDRNPNLDEDIAGLEKAALSRLVSEGVLKGAGNSNRSPIRMSGKNKEWDTVTLSLSAEESRRVNEGELDEAMLVAAINNAISRHPMSPNKKRSIITQTYLDKETGDYHVTAFVSRFAIEQNPEMTGAREVSPGIDVSQTGFMARYAAMVQQTLNEILGDRAIILNDAVTGTTSLYQNSPHSEVVTPNPHDMGESVSSQIRSIIPQSELIQRTISKKQQMLEKRRQELAALEEEIEADLSNAAAWEQNEQTQRELARVNADLEKANEALTELKEQHQAEMVLNADLTKKNEELTTTINEAAENTKQYEKKLYEANDALGTVQDELTVAKETITDFEKERKSFTDTALKAEAAKVRAQNEAKEARKEMTRAQEQRAKANAELKTAKEQIEGLKEANNSLIGARDLATQQAAAAQKEMTDMTVTQALEKQKYNDLFELVTMGNLEDLLAFRNTHANLTADQKLERANNADSNVMVKYVAGVDNKVEAKQENTDTPTTRKPK